MFGHVPDRFSGPLSVFFVQTMFRIDIKILRGRIILQAFRTEDFRRKIAVP